MEIRSFYTNASGELERDLSPERLSAARASKDGLLWIDIYDPELESADYLVDTLGFHELAVEDGVILVMYPNFM